MHQMNMTTTKNDRIRYKGNISAICIDSDEEDTTYESVLLAIGVVELTDKS